ncbi:unnamed protein product [Caenorhabditis sp. 36 PRJEB53466]|nr:unnamed protein product [Caenorhabditis sp. 36 PRJEB53466]
MFVITIAVFFSVIGAARAENKCAKEENCTLMLGDMGIETMSCTGFKQDECRCTQQRNVNFVLECHCCVPQSRKKRGVPVEAMFGLKSYVVKDETDAKPSIATAITPSALKFHKMRLDDNTCGHLKYADPDRMVANLSVSVADMSTVTLRSTHATTAKNCWNICKYNILSTNKSCTAVGFIETNAQKPINDCYILSESPTNSTGKDTSVKIYEICV